MLMNILNNRILSNTSTSTTPLPSNSHPYIRGIHHDLIPYTQNITKSDMSRMFYHCSINKMNFNTRGTYVDFLNVRLCNQSHIMSRIDNLLVMNSNCFGMLGTLMNLMADSCCSYVPSTTHIFYLFNLMSMNWNMSSIVLIVSHVVKFDN